MQTEIEERLKEMKTGTYHLSCLYGTEEHCAAFVKLEIDVNSGYYHAVMLYGRLVVCWTKKKQFVNK